MTALYLLLSPQADDMSSILKVTTPFQRYIQICGKTETCLSRKRFLRSNQLWNIPSGTFHRRRIQFLDTTAQRETPIGCSGKWRMAWYMTYHGTRTYRR